MNLFEWILTIYSLIDDLFESTWLSADNVQLDVTVVMMVMMMMMWVTFLNHLLNDLLVMWVTLLDHFLNDLLVMMMWITLLNHLLDDLLVARSFVVLLLNQNLLDDWLDDLDHFVAHMDGSVEMLVDGLLVGHIGRSVEVDGLWLVDDRRVIDSD